MVLHYSTLPLGAKDHFIISSLVRKYFRTGRAIVVTTASALLKMLKFLVVKVFKSLYLLNLWIELVDILPDVSILQGLPHY